MSTQDNNSIEAILRNEVLGSIGNSAKSSGGVAATISTPLFVDSSGKVAQGAIPYSMPLSAGATNTNFSVMTIVGSSTLSADDIMHQTLVAGAGVTTWTKTGFIKVNITDNAGNITSGDHYIQFGTLT